MTRFVVVKTSLPKAQVFTIWSSVGFLRIRLRAATSYYSINNSTVQLRHLVTYCRHKEIPLETGSNAKLFKVAMFAK